MANAGESGLVPTRCARGFAHRPTGTLCASSSRLQSAAPHRDHARAIPEDPEPRMLSRFRGCGRRSGHSQCRWFRKRICRDLMDLVMRKHVRTWLKPRGLFNTNQNRPCGADTHTRVASGWKAGQERRGAAVQHDVAAHRSCSDTPTTSHNPSRLCRPLIDDRNWLRSKAANWLV